MTRQVFSAVILISIFLLGVKTPAATNLAPTVILPNPPPKTEKARKIQALVNKAEAVLAAKGKNAYIDFRKKGSQWFNGDIYLFVCDFHQITLFNAAFPEREGKDTSNEKDSNGKFYHQELVRMAADHGSGWVDYFFPKPGQSKPSRKWTYVKTIRVDGNPSFVGAGFYP